MTASHSWYRRLSACAADGHCNRNGPKRGSRRIVSDSGNKRARRHRDRIIVTNLADDAGSVFHTNTEIVQLTFQRLEVAMTFVMSAAGIGRARKKPCARSQ